jgi:hypothetical protein
MFRPGDKVRCIDMPIHYCDKLNIGNVYTVDEIRNSWLLVKENNKINAYEQVFFELVQEKEKHYKWSIMIEYISGKKVLFNPTEHYVSENKIEDYIAHVLAEQNHPFNYTKTKLDLFVED